MIFDLQDATKNQKLIDAAKISEPQLLAGIDLDRLAIEKRKLNDQMNEGKSALQDKAFLHEDIDVRGQFQKSKDKVKQSLYRERQVDDLHAIIYGKSTDQQEYLGGQILDDIQALDLETNRFDGNPLRFTSFARPQTKRLLKKRFVTGQTRDKIMDNLLNLSDSDGEGRDQEGNTIDKDQLRRMESNATKGTKEDKRRKRLENDGIKVDTDSDENSLDEVDGDSDADQANLQKTKQQQEAKESAKEVKPLVKSREEIKKSLFMG